MDYRIEDLTKEDAAYIGGKINGIVPREVDAEVEEFVLKVENENGEIVGGCIAEAYEYHWSRMFLNTLWVDERYRHQGIGSMILREVERIARQKGCRVVTLGTASYMARPFYEKHGYTVFTTLKMINGYLSYSLVKYLDRETPEYVPSDNSGARFRISFGNEDDAKLIENGIVEYSEAHEGKFESADFAESLSSFSVWRGKRWIHPLSSQDLTLEFYGQKSLQVLYSQWKVTITQFTPTQSPPQKRTFYGGSPFTAGHRSG